MPWLIVLLGYLLGSIPTAYIAGHLLRCKDIRQIGNGNMGAANSNNSADANRGWSGNINSPYQQEYNSSQRPFVCPSTAGMLVVGSHWSACHLQYDPALLGGLHPLSKERADHVTPSIVYR
ncbi:glycerol-3-phosphate acyltransferase [Chloroflexota bacterium]